MNLDSQLITSATTKIEQTAPASQTATASARKILVGIIVVATLLRLASAVYQGNTVVPLPGIYDQISYDGLARRVVEGHGFSFAEGHWPATPAGEPTAHWSYLYTLYLAAVYALFGPQPIVARLIQAVVAGVLHSWLAWRIGRRIFGPTTGLIAAGLSAVYIYFFYYAGGVLTETFYIIGILWTFDVALRLTARARPADPNESSPALNWWLWLELGLSIGLTVLLRQVFLFFGPFLFLWLWWNLPQSGPAAAGGSSLRQRFHGSTLKGLIATTLVIVVLIVPWTIRNYQAFGTFVPLNTNAGFAFFWGNHPIHGTSFIPLLPTAGPSYGDLIPPELRSLNEAELDRALLKKGIGFIIEDPRRFVLLSLSRTVEYFRFWPSPESGTVSNISRVGSFGILLPFILYGLWLSTYEVRRPAYQGQPVEIILLYLFIIVYTAIHLLTWTLIRYRLPVDAVLIIFAGYGLEDIAKRVKPLLREFVKPKWRVPRYQLRSTMDQCDENWD
jgi:hypothetical protein